MVWSCPYPKNPTPKLQGATAEAVNSIPRGYKGPLQITPRSPGLAPALISAFGAAQG